MNFPFQIARRYLFSKKSVNVINLISILSVMGVAVGTLALIVVLSAFNGISQFIDGMLSSFDADLRISAAEGKHFDANHPALKDILAVDGIISMAKVIEDNALASYNQRQKYITLKGVSENYAQSSGIDSMIVYGKFKLQDENQAFAVIGYGVAIDLGLGLGSTKPIQLYYPKRGNQKSISINNAFNHDYIFTSGVFSIQQEIDNQYVVLPLSFAQKLLQLDNRISAIELRLNPNANLQDVKTKVAELMGDGFLVQDRYEQNVLIYQVMRSEKWASFIILAFILLIASFNLLGSLTMIIIDKKNDIFVLKSMGADNKMIKQIFLIEGWLISLIGAFIGIAIGIILILLQTHFHLVKLPSGGAFAISAYPVVLMMGDVLATLAVVILIGFFVSWYPLKSLPTSNEA